MHPSPRHLRDMGSSELRAYHGELAELEAEHGSARYRERMALVETILSSKGEPMIRCDFTEPQLRAILKVVAPVVSETCQDDPTHPLFQAERELDGALLAFEQETSGV